MIKILLGVLALILLLSYAYILLILTKKDKAKFQDDITSIYPFRTKEEFQEDIVNRLVERAIEERKHKNRITSGKRHYYTYSMKLGRLIRKPLYIYRKYA